MTLSEFFNSMSGGFVIIGIIFGGYGIWFVIHNKLYK